MYIYGKNPIKEGIKANKVKKIFISNSLNDKLIMDLINKYKIPYVIKNNNELNNLVKNKNTQGVIGLIEDYKYYDFDKLIEDGKSIKNPIIVMLDGIEDPHNLGAILRISDAFNVLGVIIKKNNQVKLNDTVAKVSAGAINYVKVCEVANLTNSIIRLKKEGYWIVATDGEGKIKYSSIDVNSPLVVIIGSEGKGVSRLIKDNSDFIVSIPMLGHVNSLNASNSLSIVLSNIIDRR